MIGETVTRWRAAPVEDPYSADDSALDWETPDELDIPNCAVASGPTSDPNVVLRDMVVSDFTVYAPHGSDVEAADRVVIRGLVCEVVGRPFEWVSPFTGRTPGLVVQANVVDG